MDLMECCFACNLQSVPQQAGHFAWAAPGSVKPSRLILRRSRGRSILPPSLPPIIAKSLNRPRRSRCPARDPPMLRLGIVDFDSSHSIELTRRFNACGIDADQVIDGARVVLGCPGESVMSPERIPGFAAAVQACGVELVSHPPEMLGQIDAVLILSLCGGVHLERVRPFLEAGIPAFVDKPFACGLNDAREIVQLAAARQTLVCSSSASRFADEVTQFQARADLFGKIGGVVVYGPTKRAAGNPGLFHYGIHATETLFALLGPGCVEVTATCSEQADVITGRWNDGRLGTIRGRRDAAVPYGFVAFCERALVPQSISTRYSYRNLGRRIVAGLQAGTPIVPLAETLEIMAFIETALRSETAGGIPVPVDDPSPTLIQQASGPS